MRGIVIQMKDEQWVWVVVHGPEGREQLLGQQDSEGHVGFVPCFLSKDDAINGLSHLTRAGGEIHTVQAMIFEDLKRYSAQNGFRIFILKATGEIIDRVPASPEG